MSFGFQIFRPDGSLLLSNDSTGFVFLDVIPVGAGAAGGGKGYPQAAGMEVFWTQLPNAPYVYTSLFHSVGVDYSSGYPTVFWSPRSPSAGADIYIFAR